MNFQYYTPGPSDDGDQNPRQQPIAFVIGGPQPQQPEHVKMDDKTANEILIAKIRIMHANARTLEMSVMLRGMEEMRNAINMPEIKDGDTGSTERPPLTPAFDDVNRGKLQAAYLTMCERYVNYCDHMLRKELSVQTTNEIKKV